MSDAAARPAPAASHAQLWSEFVLLFVGVPVLMAVFFEDIQRNRALFPTIIALAALALFLLARTPGWRFRYLFRGPVRAEWRIVLGFWLVSASVCTAFVFAIDPDMFLWIVKVRPELWLMIMLLYPLLSAWPQEVIYRALFFERYQALIPSAPLLVLANGALFGWGHLFYDNWIAIAMTAAGGMVMGWAYLRERSMALAWVLHSLAGQLIFTAGLGRYFYHGAVPAG